VYAAGHAAEGQEAMDQLIYRSATDLARLIRDQEVSSEEVVNAHLLRIAEVNPKLNAVVQPTENPARIRARQADDALARGEIWGPLHGVPMTVKDSLCTASAITTAGTPLRKDHVPARDATVVARMHKAGAILLGKTNCTELCGSGETDNQLYGRTNNPYDLERSTGGSSGGEVAIIAAGGSPIGLGSDFGGSIRGPAHLCGVAGLNPTMGRVPRTGHIPPYGGAFDTARIGPMARYVEDLALVLEIISGPDNTDPSVIPMPLYDHRLVNLRSLRVAFHTDNGVYPTTSDTGKVIREAAKELARMGMTVIEDCPSGLCELMEIANALGSAVRSAEQGGMFREFREDKPLDADALSGHVDAWLGSATSARSDDAISASELLAWTWKWDLCKSKMLSFLERYDAILCAADPDPALPHGFATHQDFPNERITGYTKPYSMAGWPSVVVRAGSSAEGLPIGVQIVAGPWREDVVLAIAQCLETALGGWRPPPI
jgi:amidase